MALKNTKIYELSNYLEDVWGFKVVPKNNFEYFKRWIWFQKRNNYGNIEYEIEIIPTPPEVTHYITCTKSVFKPVGNCFKVKVYYKSKKIYRRRKNLDNLTK